MAGARPELMLCAIFAMVVWRVFLRGAFPSTHLRSIQVVARFAIYSMGQELLALFVLLSPFAESRNFLFRSSVFVVSVLDSRR